MKNTFSLTNAAMIATITAALILVVFSQLDWRMINSAIAHAAISTDDEYLETTLAGSHGDYADDPELDMAIPADLLSTSIYVLDESLAVAIDTTNYTFAVYDTAGTSGGEIETVNWSGDTCNVHVGDDYVFRILHGKIVFAGEQ